MYGWTQAVILLKNKLKERMAEEGCYEVPHIPAPFLFMVLASNMMVLIIRSI